MQPLWHVTEVNQPIAKLESDVSSRDEQIELLKSRLQKLMDEQNQKQWIDVIMLESKNWRTNLKHRNPISMH